MKLKKFFSALALSAAMLLCGCSGEGEDSADDSSSSVPVQLPEISAKVGYIYNEKMTRDNMTSMFEKTRYDVQTALEVDTCYVDNVSVSQFPDAVATLKENGCNIIVSASSAFANSAYSVAKSDKDIYMISYGGTQALSNLFCLQPKLYQPAFVCGAVAAYNSDAHMIGVIADDSMFNVTGVVDAFVLGVEEIYKQSATDVKVCYAYSEAESKQAVDELNRLGCDVVFIYQSNNYSAAYADSIGMQSIAFLGDILYAAPKRGLMGYYTGFATIITDTVSNCINDNFSPGVYVGGLSEAFVKITAYSANCKKKTDSVADSLYDYVKKGQAKIFVGEIRDLKGAGRVSNGTVLNHEEILDLDYLVYGVTYTQRFIQPIENIIESDLVIKTDFLR